MQKIDGILAGLIVNHGLDVNFTSCRVRWNRWYDFEIYEISFLSSDCLSSELEKR